MALPVLSNPDTPSVSSYQMKIEVLFMQSMEALKVLIAKEIPIG